MVKPIKNCYNCEFSENEQPGIELCSVKQHLVESSECCENFDSGLNQEKEI